MKKLPQFEIDYHKSLPYWTPVEASALLFGVNPKLVNPDKLPDKIENIYTILMRAIDKNEKPLSFSKEDGEIQLDQFSFIRWAKWKRRHKIPDYFQTISVTKIIGDVDLVLGGYISQDEYDKNAKMYYEWKNPVDMEELNKRNDKLPLKKMPGSNTMTINLDSDKLSRELKICIKAYQNIYENGWEKTQKGSLSPTGTIKKWLSDYYPDLLDAEVKRICTVVNIYKKDGSPTSN